MILTHCLPTGSLTSGENPVPAIPGGGQILTPTGAKRGIVVWNHGLSNTYTPFPVALVGGEITLVNSLVANGWVVLNAVVPGDDYTGGGLTSALINDLVTDSGHGSRFQATTLHWWDHVVDWVAEQYGSSFPIVPMGLSFGGWTTLAVATQRTSTIAGYASQVPVTLVWCIHLAGVFDEAPNTVYTLSSSENGLTLPQSTLTVNETITGLPTSGALVVQATNYQAIRYTGWSGSTFTGITGGDGTSTMSTHGQVIQSTFTSGMDISMTALNALGNGSQGTTPVGYMAWETADETIGYANTLQLYNNATAANAPVTGYQGSGPHGINSTDVTQLMSWVTGTLNNLCPPNF